VEYRQLTRGGKDDRPSQFGYGDTGGASRFFYVAKASSAERNAGLEGFEERVSYRHNHDGRDMANPRNAMGDAERRRVERGEPGIRPSRNVHPTVKPIALMRWLVRLITPPGGVVLDPFAGSGTTGIAAVLEGFEFVGMEREAEYVAIAEARIAWWAKHPDGMELVKALEAERDRQRIVDSGQLGMEIG
jgi:site-specific DNA-methyltransferase (adenine-specific)